MENKEMNVECGCGKFICDSLPHRVNKTQCDFHPELEARIKHHTEGGYGCEANFRTPDQEREWQAERARWQVAKKQLPDLKAVMAELENHDSLLDSHSMFEFVVGNPEAATICLSRMYETLSGIAVGKAAMAEIPTDRGVR